MADLSGVDKILLFNAEAEAMASEAMLAAIRGMMQRADSLAQGKDVTWGDRYLREAKERTIETLKAFAAIDVPTLGQALALHGALREYRRVADFADGVIAAGVDAVRVMNGDEPIGDEVGEPVDGEESYEG